MAYFLQKLRSLSQSGAIRLPREAYAKHRYATPLFVLGETLSAFRLHNGLSLSASLSFYAMFALIPMALLIFFMLSHLVVSSDYAIVKLAIITSNLVPKLSQRIMTEVYNTSQHQAVWGAFGMFALLWIVTPLAAALRSAFYTISSMVEAPSFIQRKVKDVIAVLGILLMFFMFTFFGLVLEKVLGFLQPALAHSELMNSLSTLALGTLLITLFYRAFFPVRVAWRHILVGSFVTALLWMAMRPLFGIFLQLNQSYGTVFGGMKNMFISIGWLYYTFAVFLLGTELISTLRKKDVLLLRGLFSSNARNTSTASLEPGYLRHLMQQYGRQYQRGDYVFRQGEDGLYLYYIASGHVQLEYAQRPFHELSAGDYFGEMAVLAETQRTFDARVASASADIILISSGNMQTLMTGEPRIALDFLKRMARQLQNSQDMRLSGDGNSNI